MHMSRLQWSTAYVAGEGYIALPQFILIQNVHINIKQDHQVRSALSLEGSSPKHTPCLLWHLSLKWLQSSARP